MTWKPKYRAYPKLPWNPHTRWRVVRVRRGFEAVLVANNMTMIDAICLRLRLEYGGADEQSVVLDRDTGIVRPTLVHNSDNVSEGHRPE